MQPKHVLDYLQRMSDLSSLQFIGDGGDTNQNCFDAVKSAFEDLNGKTVFGNAACVEILTNAKTTAEAKMKSELENIKTNSKNIQSSFQSCLGESLTTEEALSCFEKEVS